MYKRVLIALDLEGVNFAVGEAYNTLTNVPSQYEIAKSQAIKEVNAAAEALFDAGADTVGLWDNHAGGGNIDPALLDKRIVLHSKEPGLRMGFAAGKYDCICYFGYHTMEGTLGGVLAHTMSSKIIQYYKINGRYVGEVDMDAAIAASHGMPSRFFCGGDLTCEQAKRSVPDIITVATKKELGRNKAEFRDNSELLAEIKSKIAEAVNTEGEARELDFPLAFEKSFKRVEDAEKHLIKLRERGVDCDYLDDDIMGKDAHTVVSRVNNIEEFIKSI